MAEKKKSELKEGHADLSASFSVKLDMETLNKLLSGPCVIASTIPPENQKPTMLSILVV